jgi:hypothetical protein
MPQAGGPRSSALQTGHSPHASVISVLCQYPCGSVQYLSFSIHTALLETLIARCEVDKCGFIKMQYAYITGFEWKSSAVCVIC